MTLRPITEILLAATLALGSAGAAMAQSTPAGVATTNAPTMTQGPAQIDRNAQQALEDKKKAEAEKEKAKAKAEDATDSKTSK